MTVVFYINAIPEDMKHGFYQSPLLSVKFPYDWNGTKHEALEAARKEFKEQFGKTDTEMGASYRFD